MPSKALRRRLKEAERTRAAPTGTCPECAHLPRPNSFKQLMDDEGFTRYVFSPEEQGVERCAMCERILHFKVDISDWQFQSSLGQLGRVLGDWRDPE